MRYNRSININLKFQKKNIMKKEIQQYFQNNLENQDYYQFVKVHNKINIKDLKVTYKLNYSNKDLLMLSTSIYKVKDLDYIKLLYIYDLLSHHICDCNETKNYSEDHMSYALLIHDKIIDFVDTIIDDDLKY